MKGTTRLTEAFLRALNPLALVVLLALRPDTTLAATFDVPDGDVAALKAAIAAANETAEADVINLASGGIYTLTAIDHGAAGPAINDGATGLPAVTSQITLNGNGATIRRSGAAGTPDFRILRVGTGGDLTLHGVTIRGGRGVNGGGVLNDIGGTLRLLHSTVTDNGGAEGGGIFNFRGTLVIVNSTISQNYGFGARAGGGILTVESVANTIVNSTIFENQADGQPGFRGRGDALADSFSGAGAIVVKNSIFASPSQDLGSECFGIAPGVMVSLGHNIAADNSCRFNAAGDFNSTDPLLGPLTDNGGPTPTHAPLIDSPAVDRVPLADCTDASGVPIATDQRGVARPRGPGCDVGAHETDKCHVPPLGRTRWWPGDGTAADIVGGNHGTLVNGAGFAPGLVGEAFSFDGVDSHVLAAPYAGGPIRAFDFWFMSAAPIDPASPGRYLAQFHEGSLGRHQAVGFGNTSADSGSEVIALHHYGDADRGRTFVEGITLEADTWHHFAASWNGSSYDLYVDGVIQTTTKGTAPNHAPLFADATAFRLGNAVIDGLPLPGFAGLVDEVGLFNRALSATEIRAIYDAGSSGQCKTVVDPARRLCCQSVEGGGTADILWRNGAGHVATWRMAGGTIAGTAVITDVPAASSIVGLGDVDGDGHADVLWRNAAGDLTVWLMNGATVVARTFIANVPPTWTIVGLGDFDGDGKADILWRDTSGRVALWLMNGPAVHTMRFLAEVPTSWMIAGVRDLDGDGTADILWRNDRGGLALWRMTGGTIAGASFIANVPLDWTIVGLGDFDGDGKADILWRDGAGTLALWSMDGATILGTAMIASVPPVWTIAGLGDFGGDGKTDILWRNLSGGLALWQMNGATIAAHNFIATVPISWIVQ